MPFLHGRFQWAAEEDDDLRDLVDGGDPTAPKMWSDIASKMPGDRSGKQCRRKARNPR